MELPRGKRVLSAAQPTGEPHIGNYLGAFQQWVALQNAGNDCLFPIVDLHAITVPYDAKTFPDLVLKTAALYLAVGIDPKKSILFVQSHVPAHTEAAWLLTTITPFGELARMTQFKEKGGGHTTVGVGLFTYPILMAADILLHNTDLVPVGEDQLQHVEFARTLARKFNTTFGETFTEPRAHVLKETARVMSLTDPTKKMSKSDPPFSAVALWDEPDVIRKKLRGAHTDSGTAINPKNLGPALRNLLGIYAALGSDPIAEKGSDHLSAVVAQFAGKGYAAFKDALADLLIERLAPIRTRANSLLEDRAGLAATLADGAARAARTATTMLGQMKERMGLLARVPRRGAGALRQSS